MNQHTPAQETTETLVRAVMKDTDGVWVTIDEILSELPVYRTRQAVRPKVKKLVEQGLVEARERSGRRIEYTWKQA